MIGELLRKVTPSALARGSRFSAPDRQAIARCVFEAESRTSAELVLVVRRRSGAYRDADYLAGLALLMLTLVYKLFSETEFDPLAVPVPLLLAFALGALVSAAAEGRGPRRWLTTERRRRAQVQAAARAAFVERDLGRLPARTGILLYYSELEHQGVLLADQGARAAIQDERLQRRLAEACRGPRREATAAIGGFIRTLGVHLGRVLPRTDDLAKTNLLEDAPEL